VRRLGFSMQTMHNSKQLLLLGWIHLKIFYAVLVYYCFLITCSSTPLIIWRRRRLDLLSFIVDSNRSFPIKELKSVEEFWYRTRNRFISFESSRTFWGLVVVWFCNVEREEIGDDWNKERRIVLSLQVRGAILGNTLDCYRWE